MHRFRGFRQLTACTDLCFRSCFLLCFRPPGSSYSAWTPPLPRSWAVILLCATGAIGYLPVPVLTAIVISALLNVVEVHLAVRLFRVSRQEFFIFMAAFVVVLFLGTIYGVLAGILLSFVAVIIKATNPPRHFRGMIPGKQEFYDLDRNRAVWPVKNVLIYRFSENLFFANIKILQSDIENNVREDTKAVILDAGAVNSIDITAADGLVSLADSLQKAADF